MDKRVAVYARVSTTGQAEDGYSIPAQLEQVKMNVRSLGDTVVDTYVDEGISGKTTDRPGYLRMLEDAKCGKFDEIVVWKIDRLSRNHLDLLKLNEKLECYDVAFRSITESFDTSTPAGKLLFNLLGSFGQFEREKIVENVRNGMGQRAREGLRNGGRMLGYKSVLTSNTSTKKDLVIDEEEAKVVRMIFKMYIEGHGYKYIATRLNELGFRTARNNSFSIQGVRLIVSNPTYVGKVRFNAYRRSRVKGKDVYTDGVHEPIIDQVTWDRAQSRFNSNKKIRHARKGEWLLTGILKCPQCGSPMVAAKVTSRNKDGSQKRYSYYQCSKYHHQGHTECKPNSVRANYAEEFVLKKLSKFAFDDVLIDRVVGQINSYVDQNVKPIMLRIDQIEKILHDYPNRRTRIFELYEQRIIDQNTLQARLKSLEDEQVDMNEEKSKLLSQIDDNMATKEIPPERVRALLKSFGTLLDIAPEDQRKQLLSLVVERITVNDKRKIDSIELKFDEMIQRTLIKEVSPDNGDASSFMPFTIVLGTDRNFTRKSSADNAVRIR